MTSFRQVAIAELTDQQVRFTPPARRREQVANAQKLLTEIEAGRSYPYQDICFRLTEYRSDALADVMFAGDDLKHDLALFIIQVERSLPALPIEHAGEEILTLEEVSKRFNVSTKTVCRWRLRGLVGRRVKLNGRSHLGFPVASVEQFVNRHKDRVEKSSKFSHLTDAEKDRIIVDARQMAATGGSLTDVSRKIALELGRSAEAVRYTIKNFDRSHPEAAVYPRLNGPLSSAAKNQIFTAAQEGVGMTNLTHQFHRSRSSMYRVVNEVKATELVRKPLEYIHTTDFEDTSLDALILGPMPDQEEFDSKSESMKAPKDVEPQMAYLYGRPLLTREQEAHLFRKMNYLKFLANKIQDKL
ncbi:MAG: helix-turn-helix transcriptional regulator, partial [Gemmataceae bacterium]